MRTQPDPAGSQAGFTLIELLVVLAIIIILTAIAIGTYLNARESRVRQEAVGSVVGLKAWEEDYWARTGGFLFSASAADRIKYSVATTSNCATPVLTSTFQQTTNPGATKGFKPLGCQFEYYVIGDRCQADCADAGAGDACKSGSPVRCFCAMALGTGVVGRTDRFCIDDLGRQFSNVAGVKDWN